MGKGLVWTAHVAWLVARLGEAVHDVYWERPIRDVQRIEHAIKRTPRKQYEQAVTDAGPRAGAQV
jgi:hypothetical protein